MLIIHPPLVHSSLLKARLSIHRPLQLKAKTLQVRHGHPYNILLPLHAGSEVGDTNIDKNVEDLFFLEIGQNFMLI
jgi:hypothetical protein